MDAATARPVRRLSFAGEPVHPRRPPRADRPDHDRRVRRLGRCRHGGDDGARHPGRRRGSGRHLRPRPAVRLPGAPAAARDRRRAADRADLARARAAPDPPRRARPARSSSARSPTTAGARSRPRSSSWRAASASSSGSASARSRRPCRIPGPSRSSAPRRRPGCSAATVVAGPAGTLRVPSALVSALEIEVVGGGHPGARLLRAGPPLRLGAVRDGRGRAAAGARDPSRRRHPGRRAGRGGA